MPTSKTPGCFGKTIDQNINYLDVKYDPQAKKIVHAKYGASITP